MKLRLRLVDELEVLWLCRHMTERGHMVSPELCRGQPKAGDMMDKIQCLYKSKESNWSEATLIVD